MDKSKLKNQHTNSINQKSSLKSKQKSSMIEDLKTSNNILKNLIKILEHKPIKVENIELKTIFPYNELAITFIRKDGSGLMLINKACGGVYAELYLHEINESLIYQAILKMEPEAFDSKAIENIAHFLNSFSLNQYSKSTLKKANPFNYIDSDKLPNFEKQTKLEDFEELEPIVRELEQNAQKLRELIESSSKPCTIQTNLLIFGSERLEVKASSPESRKNHKKGVRD